MAKQKKQHESKMDDKFAGSTWNGEASVDWNKSTRWNRYYDELTSGYANNIRMEHVAYRDCHRLTDFFTKNNILPLSENKPAPRILDAGCGLSVIPSVLAYWGFQVTAIDSSANAISVSRDRNLSEVELAKCIKIWNQCQDIDDTFELIDDPSLSLKVLNKYQSSCGALNYLQADWHDKSLVRGEFDFIYCSNSLRRSTKPYWRETLSRFFHLLALGGTLILETVNAIGIQSEVRDILFEIGYCSLTEGIMPDRKYALDLWPSG